MYSSADTLLLHLTHRSSETARDQLVRQLRVKVLRGDLAEGTELPSPRRLAREHLISAGAVADAYVELAVEGVLAAAGAGSFRVAHLAPERRRALAEGAGAPPPHGLARELERARDVQRRLLPPDHLCGAGWEVAARCLPARLVAGDLYAILPSPDGTVGLVVADVAGKGLAAGLLMAAVSAMLPFVASGRPPAGTLQELNRRLAPQLGRGELVALACARFHPADGRLELANAGLPDPYRLRPGIAPEPLAVPGPRLPLGVRAKVAYEQRELRLEADDRLLLLSDGLPEARVAPGEPVGYAALERLLADPFAAVAVPEWLDGLLARLQAATGALLDDDWTALVLERTGEAGPCC